MNAAVAERLRRSEAHTWVGWVAVCAAPVALLDARYLLDTFAIALCFGIALIGLDLSVGIARQLTLATPAFMAVGGYTTAVTTGEYGWPPLAALALALVLSVSASFVIGWLILRVSGLGLMLVTLFVVIVVEEVVSVLEFFGGSFGLSGVPELSIGPLEADSPAVMALVVAVLLGTVIFGARRLMRSPFGLQLLAVGDDEYAARASGVAVRTRYVEAFVFGAVLATLAGFLYVHLRGLASPSAFSVFVLFDLLLMLFLGGVGSLWGCVLGALILGFLPGLTDDFDVYRTAFLGVLFAVVLVAAPKGIAGFLTNASGALRRRLPGGRGAPVPVPVEPSFPVLGMPRTNGAVHDGIGSASVADPPVLEVSGLTKDFGGLRALSGMDLTVPAVGVTGIVGPNGAGKTTLFNTLAGELVPTAGTVHLGDRDITGTAAHTVARLGVRRTFQIVRLAARLTVLDNVALGSVEATAGLVPSLLLRREQRRLHTIRDEARTALARVGCAHLADRHPGELPLGERRLVEVARALMGRPALLLLDEPASGLADDQRAQLGELVRELGRTTSIVVIEHDVDFIASVAERVIVMAEGAKIFEGAAEDAFRDPVVVTAYLGADVAREAIDPEPVEVES